VKDGSTTPDFGWSKFSITGQVLRREGVFNPSEFVQQFGLFCVSHGTRLLEEFNLASTAVTVAKGLIIFGLPLGDRLKPLLRSSTSALDRQRVSCTDRE
jgi:hypothetical protein